MRIVEPSAKLLHVTAHAEALIERCGRVCYKSEDRITPESGAAFVRMIRDRGHFSVLEHATATVLFVIDRGVSHELVRHRIASFSQESTRYCNYGKKKHGGEITVIKPPGIPATEEHYWRSACERAEDSYLGLLRFGVSPQIARSVLPTCLKTEIAVTANFREWMHIFDLRTSKAAHPQIRDVMVQARDLLACKAPSVFGADQDER